MKQSVKFCGIKTTVEKLMINKSVHLILKIVNILKLLVLLLNTSDTIYTQKRELPKGSIVILKLKKKWKLCIF